MISFRVISGQSWNSEKIKFHMVKLLKFKTFNFHMKFLWNWPFFHYEKIMRFKKSLSNLEAEGQGCGIIIGVTRLLLLEPFMYWNQQTVDYSTHHCIYDNNNYWGKIWKIKGKMSYSPVLFCPASLPITKALSWCSI